MATAAGKINRTHLALTGPPGIGKTTLICKLCDALRNHDVRVVGFYTEECRQNGRRVGFDVVTLDGQRGPLARVESGVEEHGSKRSYRVGQYVVQLAEFESLALPALSPKTPLDEKTIVVIDEVGKMELFSSSFVQLVRKLFSSSQKSTLVTTIPIPKGKPLGLVEEIRNSPNVTVFQVSRDNRDSLLQDLLQHIKIEK